MPITRRDWWGGIAVLTAALLLNSIDGLNRTILTYWTFGDFRAELGASARQPRRVRAHPVDQNLGDGHIGAAAPIARSANLSIAS